MIIIFIILYWVLFLGGCSIYEKIKFNDVEQKQLVDSIFKQSSTLSTVPYFVGIAEFLTNVKPLICRSFSLMMKLYSFESIVAKSTDSWKRRYSQFTSNIIETNIRITRFKSITSIKSSINNLLSFRASVLIWTKKKKES